MACSREELAQILLEAVDVLRDDGDNWAESEAIDKARDVMVNLVGPESLYEPDDALRCRLSEYRAWSCGSRRENPGELMEEIALLAFRRLKGLDQLASYQSASAQLDLVVSGNSGHWSRLMSLWHIPSEKRTVIVEAKNLSRPVSDAQFSRLCAIMHTLLDEQCQLGIFLTRRGVSGFRGPDRGDPASRIRSLRDARLTQALFHAKTGKYVVALDETDVLSLDRPGSLPRIVETKIRNVEKLGGIDLSLGEPWKQHIELPPHMARHMHAAMGPFRTPANGIGA